MSTEVRLHRVLTVLLAAALLATLTVALTGGQRAEAVDGPVEVVYVATGQNFPDALAGANLAATVGAPMLTVNPDLPIPDATATALEALDPNQIIILGGPVAVSEPVADALADYARSGAVSRIEGGDRHDTAAKIADALPDKVHDSERLGGLLPDQVSSIVGERASSGEWSADQIDFTTVASVDVEAPTNGVAFVSASVEVNNRTPSPRTLFSLLLLDWDGNDLAPSLDAAAIASNDAQLPAAGDGGFDDERTTLVMTTAVPLTAGSHTLDLWVSGDTYRTRMENVAVVFSANGSATPRGTPGIS